MSKPKVSIVLPTYNGEQYLKDSIESIKNQTYRDWELIIVNDCSTDHTHDIIREYGTGDERIRVIENEENQKLPMSLNIGFQSSTGEYRTWTSDDNLYEPDALERMVSVLDAHPEVGMVYADQHLIDENGKTTMTKKLPEPELFYQGNCVGACFMYRRDVALSVGEYRSELFLVEDYEYWLRIWCRSKLMHLPEVLYRYRVHEKSLTATRHEMIMNRTAELWMSYMDHLIQLVPSYKDKKQWFDQILLMSSDTKRKEIENQLVSYSFLYRLRRLRKRILKKIRVS